MQTLREGRYQPSPVRRVDIPKPGGGTRMLGVPTVLDRLIQQAIVLVLTPLLDPTFSPSSYGFRPGRSAHDAVRQARKFVAEGHRWVVDLDLSKFFDRVNHDILMERLVEELNRFLRGWLGYFRLAETPSRFEELDGWIRRRLRCFLLSQWKAGRGRRRALSRLGVPDAGNISWSRKGPWRLSKTQQTHQGLTAACFRSLGLLNLTDQWRTLSQAS